jgi:uncharacterized protein (TIGR02246 family)
MKYLVILTGVVCLALPVCAPPPEPEPVVDVGPLSDEDIAAVRELAHSYQEAVLANDAEAVAALYTDNATEMPADAPIRQGRAAVQSAYEAPSPVLSAFEVTSVEIDGLDDLAYDRGTWSGTFVMEGVEEPPTVTGKYLCIARKQSDGSWLWSIVIWNSDAPIGGQP